MVTKADFSTDEWKLLLGSPMLAGMAVTLADPSGIWGLLKESMASGQALLEAKNDPNAGELAKAILEDVTGALRDRGAGMGASEPWHRVACDALGGGAGWSHPGGCRFRPGCRGFAGVPLRLCRCRVTTERCTATVQPFDATSSSAARSLAFLLR